jgi:hypothetical protein
VLDANQSPFPLTQVKAPSKRPRTMFPCSPQSLLRGHRLLPTSMPLLPPVGALFLAAPSPSLERWGVSKSRGRWHAGREGALKPLGDDRRALGHRRQAGAMSLSCAKPASVLPSNRAPAIRRSKPASLFVLKVD